MPGSTPALAWTSRPRLPSPVSEPRGGMKNLGTSPPAIQVALLQQAIRENGVGVCSFLGATPQVQDWVVAQFKQPAEEGRV